MITFQHNLKENIFLSKGLKLELLWLSFFYALHIKNITKTNFYLGVQDNYDTSGEPIANIPDSYSGMFVFGAPYYFYFGLNKGYSAMDKFIKKYVNADLIIE